MCVLENMSTPNGIFREHRDARVTALVNVLFHVNKILNAKDCEGHSVCTRPCNEPRRCPGSSLSCLEYGPYRVARAEASCEGPSITP